MNTTMSKLFSETDHARISAAVRESEAQTSGEIVPFVVARSDRYEDAEWRAGFLLGFLVLVGLSLVRTFSPAWGSAESMEIAVATLLTGGGAMLAVRLVPGFTRLFAGKHLMERRVEQRAAEAFISEEVFNTSARTGILIFVSLLEHRVMVVGDAGINAKVKKEDWEDVVRRVTKGITAGRPADGLVDAIGACGLLLNRHGVTRKGDDRDELSDDLRIGKPR